MMVRWTTVTGEKIVVIPIVNICLFAFRVIKKNYVIDHSLSKLMKRKQTGEGALRTQREFRTESGSMEEHKERY